MKNILTTLLLTITTLTFAQDSLKTLSFEGSIDVYHRTKISTSNTDVAPATSFANLNGFALGMFNLVTSYE